MRKNKLQYLLIPILLLSCSKAEVPSTQEKKEKYCVNAELKKAMQMQLVNEQPIQEQLMLSGKIEYNDNDLVGFKSLLQGVVDRVYFEQGDYVKRGQVLAVVQSAQIQDLALQRRYYQNQITLIQKQIKTKKELLSDGMASLPEVTQLEHELNSNKIEIDKINAALQLYKAVGNGQFQILAPKNGYIVQKNISVGQTITDNEDEKLFSISNLKQVWVMVNIYASNLQYVHLGDNVKVRSVAYPDKIYAGKIDKIYNVFDDNEHVMKARVVLDNQNLDLMPGLSADIIIDKKNVLGQGYAIPKEAKIFENNKEYVVVYRNDCDMEVRRITQIGQNEEYIYVQEKFKPNEKVVIKNALLLYEELNK